MSGERKLDCPKYNKEMTYEDNSFNHEFGTQIIKYYYCEMCNYTYNDSDTYEEEEENDI